MDEGEGCDETSELPEVDSREEEWRALQDIGVADAKFGVGLTSRRARWKTLSFDQRLPIVSLGCSLT